MDPIDSYHAIALDKTSQPLTTFITEWGRYMYLRLPQGFLASGDPYDAIEYIPRKIKIIDDTLLYDKNIEDAFFHTWDYLHLCATAGIVINDKKFKFRRDTVESAGLKLTPNVVATSDYISYKELS